MFKTNEDCFYFLTSTCAKGPSCTYRHSPLALTCNVICQDWANGNCPAPTCPFRHSSVLPRSSVGVPCFYETTSTGCLKPECTFIHSRPRVNLKNSTTIRPANLIKKETTKPIVNTPIPPPPLPTANTSEKIPNINSNTSLPHETSTNTPIKEPESLEVISTANKTETIPRRTTVSADTESSDNVNNNSLTIVKPTNRSVITNSPKANQEELITTQSRLIVNRSVVLNEPGSVVPNRTVVQTSSTTSSNRVVVSSTNTNSSIKEKKIQSDLVDEQIQIKKFKQDVQPKINISFPCSAPSLTTRLLLSSSKELPTNNDTKPIRLNRNRLPATPSSNESSIPVNSTPTNKEKTSAGTELSKDEERRTMRLERFQKKTMSPPESTTTRNVVTSSPNERKRTASETTPKDSPPAKRLTVSSTKSIASETVPKASPVRPRFIPQPITAPSAQQPSSSSSSTTTGTSRPRQPTTAVNKRPLAAVTPAFSSLPTKSCEQTSIISTEKIISSSSPSKSATTTTISGQSISNTPNEEDESQLLKLNDSADIVDTFALIDEVLLETDDLLNFM